MTERIGLRPLSPDDAPEMAKVLADPALYQYTGGTPPTVEGLTGQYTVQSRGHSTDRTETWINHLVVFETSGKALGYVQATIPVDGGPTQIAWLIGTPWQGRGLAKEAAGLLKGELRDRGVRRLVADVHPEHTASQRVAQAIGLAPTDEVVDGEVRWAGSVDDGGGPVTG